MIQNRSDSFSVFISGINSENALFSSGKMQEGEGQKANWEREREGGSFSPRPVYLTPQQEQEQEQVKVQNQEQGTICTRPSPALPFLFAN